MHITTISLHWRYTCQLIGRSKVDSKITEELQILGPKKTQKGGKGRLADDRSINSENTRLVT